MIYSLTQTVAPVAEPVTAADAMAWARVNNPNDQALIADLIVAAREYVEEITQRQLMTATYIMGIDLFPFGSPDIRFIWNRFGVIRVPRPPLQSVTQIAYTPFGGGTVVHPTNLYQVDTAREPGRIAPAFAQVWPIPQYTTFSAVQITFVAGYASAAAVPARIRTAIKMMVANAYANRECTAEQAANELPAHYRSFLRSASVAEYC
jgi:uncharacterized phiE125 gp8 family phage protein